MTHAFAVEGKTRSTARERHDAYETPEGVTEALLRHVRFRGRILEPAAGSGKMARVLRRHGYAVDTADVQRGRDFLRRRAPADNVVTNSPYHGDMPFQFAQRALAISRGKTALLLKPGFLHSTRRREWLAIHPPTTYVYIANRIIFSHPDGRPIKGQFFDHLWIVWGEVRPRGMTRVVFEEWEE